MCAGDVIGPRDVKGSVWGPLIRCIRFHVYRCLTPPGSDETLPSVGTGCSPAWKVGPGPSTARSVAFTLRALEELHFAILQTFYWRI